MRYFLFILAFCCLCCCSKRNEKPQEIETIIETIEPRMEYGLPVDDLHRVEGTIQNGQSLGTLLASLGAKRETIHALSAIPDTIFNVRNLRAGKTYHAFYGTDSLSELLHFVYVDSPVEYVLFTLPDSLRAERGRKTIVKEDRTAQATITSSLWNAVVGSWALWEEAPIWHPSKPVFRYLWLY